MELAGLARKRLNGVVREGRCYGGTKLYTIPFAARLDDRSSYALAGDAGGRDGSGD